LSIYPKATYEKMMKRLAELEKDWVDTDVAEIRKVTIEHFARLEKELRVQADQFAALKRETEMGTSTVGKVQVLPQPQQQQPKNYLVGYWKATFDGVSLNF
jgi:hypothetical protein